MRSVTICPRRRPGTPQAALTDELLDAPADDSVRGYLQRLNRDIRSERIKFEPIQASSFLFTDSLLHGQCRVVQLGRYGRQAGSALLGHQVLSSAHAVALMVAASRM